MEFGVPSLGGSSSSSVGTSMPPPPPPCGNCAAVKRLKTCSAGAESGKWMQQKCTCSVASAVTAQLADGALPGGMSVPLTNAIDTLRPRRLFEGAGEDDDDGSAAAADAEESPQALASLTDVSSGEAGAPSAGEHAIPSVFDLIDEGEDDDPEPDAECFSIFRPPELSVDVSGELGTQYEETLGGFGQQQQQQQQQQPGASGFGGGGLSSGSGPLAFMPLGRVRSFSPSPRLHRPCTPLSPIFGGASQGEAAQHWGRGPSPPPPLPDSAASSRLDAFRGLHNQSPGLMLASVRQDLALRAADRGGSSCGASSCATPSRAPLPMRPPTPGAPGSNIRRTTSFMGTPLPPAALTHLLPLDSLARCPTPDTPPAPFLPCLPPAAASCPVCVAPQTTSTPRRA